MVCSTMREARTVAKSLGQLASSELICEVFARCFAQSHRSLLVAGGDEPFYQPAIVSDDYHQIVFRADYAASALHEAAHWCIAGEARRQLPDYGYWYEPDGRDAARQSVFESVEICPQALECLFSYAAGRRFRVSIDNLGGVEIDPFPFQLAVWQQCQRYLRNGLPPRGELFRQALAQEFGTSVALESINIPLSYVVDKCLISNR